MKSVAKPRVFCCLSILLLSLLSLSNTQAEIYKWTDETGHIHFSDSRQTDYQTEELELKINSYPSVRIEPINTPHTSDTSNNTKVIMYSTSWCAYCKKARSYFKANKIPFSEYDIEKNSRARKKYQSQGGTGSVPLIIIGRTKLQGFNITSFDKVYYHKQ